VSGVRLVGEDAHSILVKYPHIRKELHECSRQLMREVHEKGSSVMRACFYEFADDPQAWKMDTYYMYGYRYLVVPVLATG
jgi:alpha-D-xyloside xylohydrolase